MPVKTYLQLEQVHKKTGLNGHTITNETSMAVKRNFYLSAHLNEVSCVHTQR